MSVVKTLNKNATVKQQTSADLPSNPVKYITQRGSQTSTDGQLIINLGFAVDLSIKDAFMLIVDGKVLVEGSGNDYTFTSVQANNTSAQVTLTQSLTAGLNIMYILMGALVQTEPSINTLAATVANLSSGSGTGGINYITAYDAEKTAAGWNRFQDAAAVSPTDGTGTLVANNITFAQNTTNPVRGTVDFKITKDAANRQGEGVSYDFTIDRADQAKPLCITFDYSGSGVTWATSVSSIGDIQIWIYDKDAGVLIQPAAYTLDGSKRFKGVFQTSATSLNYRLIFFIGGTTATSWTFNFDNVRIGPDIALLGCPVTDWQSYTPTYTGFGTVATSNMFWRRVGDSLQVTGDFLTGTPTAVAPTFTLPSGLSIDTSKINSTAFKHSFGRGWRRYSGGSESLTTGGADVDYAVVYNGNVGQVQLARGTGTGSGGVYNNDIGTNFLVASDGVDIELITVPILGWSSTTQMSNDTDTRVVSAAYTGNSTVPTSTTPSVIKYSTKDKDTHNGYDTTTGLYTVQVAGDYEISASYRVGFTTSSANQSLEAWLYKNGVNIKRTIIRLPGSVSDQAIAISAIVPCNIGDTLAIYGATQATSVSSTSAVDNFLSIKRLSGPSSIAATETVAASYNMLTTWSQAAGTPVNYDQKIYDTHGAVSTGATTWKFTAPISGKYRISSFFNGSTANTGFMQLYKNGSIFKAMGYSTNWSSNTGYGVSTIQLNAGDYIDIRFNTTMSAAGNTAASGTSTSIDIERVGN